MDLHRGFLFSVLLLLFAWFFFFLVAVWGVLFWGFVCFVLFFGPALKIVSGP